MSDYIDRQAAIDAVMILPQKWDGMYIQDLNCRLRDALNALTSAEVETVEHGEWKPQISITGTMIFQCSKCGKYNDIHWAYCPYCGSLMDGERGAKMDAEEGAKHED